MRHALRFLTVAGIVALAPASRAATYHVRTDGGTSTQCTGLVDAPYPGSGSGQPCAWSHPFWALDASGAWRIAGGDTVIIGAGAYMMGVGAPNSTGWCDPNGAWDCHLPPLPSGPSPTQPTRLLGAAWASGCGSRPELWGTERADTVIDLDGSDNVELSCLEITDHSGCVEFHAIPSVACERNNPPFGPWSAGGIFAADASNVTLRDLDVHGHAHFGIWAGRLTDWTVERVRIAGNGGVGWDGDLGGPSSNSGTLRFREWLVEWNGCAETWPGGQPDHCWAQQNGGYGDGVGTAATAGDWIIEDSTFRYNTSDGLDLLYLGNGGIGGTATVLRSTSMGNAGDQMKVGGAATIVNCLLVSECSYFDGKPFGQEMVPGDHCRAGGSALVIALEPGDEGYLVNSTLAGEGDCLVLLECQSPTGSERVWIQNSVFHGYPDYLQPGDTTCFLYEQPAGLSAGRDDFNVVFGAKDSTGECPSGASNLCNVDPMVANGALPSFDGHLRVGSPAIDSGLPVGSLGGRVPADDHDGGARPAGAGVDRGAYEHGSSPSTVGHVLGMGLGYGNANRVRIHDALGTYAGVDFQAYGAGHWGVNVAGGDVDGGAWDEILTGPGPGDVFGPQVRGFQRTGISMGKVNFYAYGTLKYGVNVASGLLDADAFSEILSGAGPGAVFGPHVRGWNFDGNVLGAISKVSFFAYGTLRYGVNVSSGSVDGDAYGELLTGPGPGAIFGPQVRGFDYDGASVTAIAGLNFFAFAVSQYGVNLAGGDVDGDGRAEIAATPGPGPTASFPSRFVGFDPVTPLAGFDVTPFGTVYGGRVGLGDVRADGSADLLAGAGRDPAADSTVRDYDYGGAALAPLGSFVPFGATTHGVNPAAADLGY